WPDAELPGAEIAWSLFRPAMLGGHPLSALAHVRFPLGGFHMALMSEDPELVATHLASTWKMLNTVDLKRIPAAETSYLFTVCGLHIYAHHFRQKK
ncbi:MAG: hypothetical protein HN380_32925, partial [Victivallales bacterium]|nr:hypothetical protein [Victivallales bacterium]